MSPIRTAPPRHQTGFGDYAVWVIALSTIIAFGTGTYQTWQRAGYACAGHGDSGSGILPPFGGQEVVRFLLLGTDDRTETGRSDTMILASVYPQTHRVVLLSIPRDSRVRVPDHGVDKINSAYAHGGVTLVMETLRNWPQVQPIQYYAQCDFRAFQKIVDLLGGVEIEVEKDMRYTDRAQDLYIRLRRGHQRLKGYDAMCYVRYRSDGQADIGRIERQQKFLRAALRALLKPSSLPKVPAMLTAMRAHMKTNMGVGQVLDLARVLPQVQAGDLLTGSLPGEPRMIRGISYWELDSVGSADLIRSLDAQARSAGSAQDRPDPVVEVLNGCGEAGAAAKVAEKLTDRGFKVARTGNAASSDYSQSTICAYESPSALAEEIRAVLQCGTIVCVSRPAHDVEATVIVGRDLSKA
jgi:LCP family protein required for cell wall assembly